MRLLLGQDPGPVAHTDPNALAPAPENLPTGLPSQLLERRPDIQQAEAQLMAANAQVGVGARAVLSAAQHQRLRRSGRRIAEATSSAPPEGWLTASARSRSPSLKVANCAGQLQLSKEQKEEMGSGLSQAILGAFRDVSNSLIAVNKQRATRQEQEKLTAAADDASRLARVRYQGGATSYLEVLTNDSNPIDGAAQPRHRAAERSALISAALQRARRRLAAAVSLAAWGVSIGVGPSDMRPASGS